MTRRELLKALSGALAALGAITPKFANARPKLMKAGSVPETISRLAYSSTPASVPGSASASDWRRLMGDAEVRPVMAANHAFDGAWTPMRPVKFGAALPDAAPSKTSALE